MWHAVVMSGISCDISCWTFFDAFVTLIHCASYKLICYAVCNICGPYSADWNFWQCFYAIWYLGHPLTSTENFRELVPGERLCLGGGLNARGPNIAILDLSKATSRKRCKIGGKLVLIINRKSYMSFNWYQNRWPWMTLDGVVALILRYFTEFGSFRRAVHKRCSPKHLAFSDISLCDDMIYLRSV